jgi:hypothetical protein
MAAGVLLLSTRRSVLPSKGETNDYKSIGGRSMTEMNDILIGYWGVLLQGTASGQ